MKDIPRVLLLITALTLATEAAAQRVLYRFADRRSGDFGRSVSRAGDVDRDGFEDLIVGAPNDSRPGTAAGTASVFSGRTGQRLWFFAGTTGDHFGHAVAAAGDVDGDRHGDVIVGAWGNNRKTGAVFVYSGRTGQPIGKPWRGNAVGDTFGESIAGVGDADGDGRPDFLVGATQTQSSPQGTGYAVLFLSKGTTVTLPGRRAGDAFGHSVGALDLNGDGRPNVLLAGAPGEAQGNGAVHLFRVPGYVRTTIPGTRGEQLGFALASAGDVDGDQLRDFIAGAPSFNGNQGRALIYSGRSFSRPMLTVTGAAASSFGWSVTGVGDLNCDRRAEFAVGSWPSTPAVGYVQVFSGTTVVFTARGRLQTDRFGLAVCAAGDPDGNQVPDLLVGAPRENGGTGAAYVLSGQLLHLRSVNVRRLSLSTGGRQFLTLEAGRMHAGRLWVMLGTASGTCPGLKIPAGVVLRLNPDAYFLLLLGSPNSILNPSIGVLNSSGAAQTQFTLASGLPPSLAGTVLHHAYLLLDPTNAVFDFVSNPVVLRLVR